MDKANVLMRVSTRFQRVCKMLAEKYSISLPVATEVILDEFYKSGLIIYGRKLAVTDIIEKVTREIQREIKKETQKNTMVTQPEKKETISNQSVTGSNTQVT
jgi:hypothetical protein